MAKRRPSPNNATPDPASAPAPEPTPTPAPIQGADSRRAPDVPPPGRVVRPLGEPKRHGLAGLRQRLGLSDRTTVDDVADSALAELARLEGELSKPRRCAVVDTTPQSVGMQL